MEMASLTVTDIPDDLLEKMRGSAELRGRSVNDEAIAAFERQVGFAFPDQDVVVAMIRAGRDAMDDFILPRRAER
jgi:plasmid stability protein